MCVQCNGELSSTIRTKREGNPPLASAYGEAFFDQIRPFLPHAERCVFLGGEPFLQPEAARVWDLLLELDPSERPEVDVTTNGTVWNAKVERYVRELAMNVAVSIDGASADTTDAIRIGSRHDRVVEHARRLGELTRATESGFAVNTCVMPQNVHELLDVMLLIDDLDAEACPHVVTYPPTHSLLDLPLADLSVVIAELEADDARAQVELGRSRGAWDRVLERLRSHLADLEVAVVLGPPSSGAGSVAEDDDLSGPDDAPGPDAVEAASEAPTAVAEDLQLATGPVESVEAVRPESVPPPVGAVEDTEAQERAAVLEELAAARRRLDEAGIAPVRFRAVSGIVVEVDDQPWAAAFQPASWVGAPVEGLIGLVGEAAGAPATVEVLPPRGRLVESQVTASALALWVTVGEWTCEAGDVLDGLVTERDR